jgi:hypothetical protein
MDTKTTAKENKMSDDFRETRIITVEPSEYRALPPIQISVRYNDSDKSTLHLTVEEAADLRDRLSTFLSANA